ncbi:hypothetical protein [Aquibacillus kalidii]|uniref:hypothetical protein n=1 Tax=Aquibacillus kalidii TaxID=2762597 RepID=UPI001645118B|nr:hypothetical protein [Aquibacillus kalidii]
MNTTTKDFRVTCDIKNLDSYKNLLEVFTYIYLNAESEIQTEAVKQLNDKNIEGLTITRDMGDE